MKFIKTLFASLALTTVVACTTTIQTQVDAFSTIPADIAPKTVFIAPYKGVSSDSLEWQTNARSLATILASKGFGVVGEKKNARLTAHFGFAIDEGERVTTTYSVPQYGVTGYSGYDTFGTNSGNSYASSTTLRPIHGVVGYRHGTQTRMIYTRSVSIDMIDNQTGKKVFEASASSQGHCGSFTTVAKPIISAVLSNFPAGRSGKVRMPMDAETTC